MEAFVIDYFKRLTLEQRETVGQLRAVADKGEFGMINEFMPNGWLRSHSVGMTTFSLPEFIIYGLREDETQKFFDAIYASVGGRSAVTPYPDVQAGMVTPDNARRLVPLLQCVFPKGFLLMQFMWPDSRGRYPHDRNFEKKLRARQPCIWGLDRLPDAVIPAEVLVAEREEAASLSLGREAAE
jgi:hypothetical protein